MQVVEKSKDGLKTEFTVTIPVETIQQQRQERLAEISKTVKFDGFRPGKVPAQLIEKRYGQSISGEILQKTVDATIPNVLKEQDIRPAMQPKVNVTAFNDNEPLVYELTVEALPTIPDVDIKKISIEQQEIEVTDKDLEASLDNIKGQFQEYKPLKRKRAVKLDDEVEFDFSGSIDGVKFEGGTAEKAKLVIGSGQFIPGFEEQIIGKKIDEEFDVNVTFPENYGAAELAGKDAVFACKIHDIQEPAEFELTDDVAEKCGAKDVADLKEKIKESVKNQKAEEIRPWNKKALLDALDEKVSIDLPPSLVEEELKMIQQEDKETDEKELKSLAERRVKLGLVVADIGTKNNIEVSEEEIRTTIIQQAMRMPEQQRMQFMQFFSENPSAIDRVRAPLFEEKVIDYILENVKSTTKTITDEEFTKLVKEDQEEEAKKKPAKTAAKKKSTAKKSETTKENPAAKKAVKKEAKETTEPKAKKAPAKKTTTKKPATKKSA